MHRDPPGCLTGDPRWLKPLESGLIAVLAALTIALGGCAARSSRMVIVDYPTSGEPTRYAETFPEALYSRNDDGNVNVVLRRVYDGDGNPDQAMTQTMHILSIWRPIPGTTVSDRTQINAVIRYQITTNLGTATFVGTGSLFFKTNRRGNVLTGRIEDAALRPVARVFGRELPFENAKIHGAFRAVRDRRRVTRLVNEMGRWFAQPPASGAG